MLSAVGLNAEEELVYRLLLGQPVAHAADLAAACGLAGDALAGALGRLEACGLVRPGGDGYVAAPPAVALGAMITERREQLRAAELALVALDEAHRVATAGRTINELIEVVTGVDAIRQRFIQVQHAAREQVRCFVTGRAVAVAPGENPAEEVGTERGVRYRVLIDRSALAEPRMLEEIAVSLRQGSEVRLTSGLPIKLVLADEDLALVPLTVSAGDEPGAVLLHRSGLVGALGALFDALWAGACPLALDGAGDAVEQQPHDGPTDLDRRILALLLAGLTDQATAAQLDVSMRTLQRRLRHLMDLAGVESRMQLGWQAARRGWV